MMEKDLRLAFLSREKAELFLSNLEKLRSDNSVNEMSYNALKNEYLAVLQHATLRLEHIKGEFSKTLAQKNRELNIYKQELANMEARFKVGQIAAASFMKASKEPEKKIRALEDHIAHLSSLINARHSAEVTVPEKPGLSLFGVKLSSERPAPAASGHIAYTEPAPLPPPPPPPLPPPPPPPIQPPPVMEPVKVQDATSISSLMILPDRALPGSTIGVIATIINTGTEPLQHRAELKINNRVEHYSDVNLNPGQSEELTFMTIAGAPGDYSVSVDSAQGILKVLPSA